MDQPKPKDGKETVMPHLTEEFSKMAKLRYDLGIERYGKPLQTFNGRDAGQDAMEEWFDLGIYLKQQRMEYVSLQAENILLHQYIKYCSQFMRGGVSFQTWIDQWNSVPKIIGGDEPK